MAHSFKWSPRITRLRAPVFAALIVALAGCDSTESLDPNSSLTPAAVDQVVGGDDADVQAVPVGEPALASASFAGGIPFGMNAQPVTAFGSRFNGAKITVGPAGILKDLSGIQSRGGKVIISLAGSPRYFTDDKGRFSLSKWKARVDRYKNINFNSYISDGTVMGHYLLDEPNDKANWNGEQVSPSVLEEMAKYSKDRWPGMPTVVRVAPSYLGSNHRYLDAAWAQYLDRRGDVDDYLKQSVADAQQRGLALIVGLNVLKGGTPNGTKMTAKQVEAWGSALLSSSYPCAFFSYQHNSTYLQSSGVSSAMDALRKKAQNRSARSCRG